MARITLDENELRVVGREDWNKYAVSAGEEAVLVSVGEFWNRMSSDAKAALLAEMIKNSVKPFPDTEQPASADR